MTPLQELETSLRAACERSPEIRAVVSSLASWLASITSKDGPAPAAGTAAEAAAPIEPLSAGDSLTNLVPPAPSAPTGTAAPSTPRIAAAPTPALPMRTRTLEIGGVQVPVAVPYDFSAPKTFGVPRVVDPGVPSAHESYAGMVPELSRVAARARVKADGCRWAVKRRALKAANADHISEVAPTDRAIVERAKAQPACWVWMVDPKFTERLPDDSALLVFAALYDNLAAAADAARTIDADAEFRRTHIKEAVALLAEAQSALRIACFNELGIEREQDQMDAFIWIKEFTKANSVYVERFLRLDDPADPGEHARVAADIADLRARYEAAQHGRKARKNLVNKVKYACKRLGEAGSEPEALEQASSLDSAVAALLGTGLPPSDAELREIVMPVVNLLPESFDASDTLRRVLAEVQRYEASRDEAKEPPPARAPSAEVLEAARLLEGKRVFMVGGQRNEMSRRALERDLRLGELRWMTTVEHQSTAPFESEVARADVVIVLVRFSGHAFVDDLGHMCERYDKAYVRVPAGYGTTQVAHHVMKQVSRKLADTITARA